ncbi:MAG: UDP-N-acetylglucosamine 4,6-dehydratase (inverting) [Deltaproteobacteria bacterium]|nr:UDP-N-acetylglucosamine 4,6-dehydratase (inverting) [Deltaproteobacteria bacterium]
MRYRIQEVSEKLQIPKSTIRFWEKTFSNFIQPGRTNGRQRRYSDSDIDYLKKIKRLLYEKKRSIDETQYILKHGNADLEKIDWKNQSVLLTGGTGSFGRHFCRVMQEKYQPKVIRIYSRDELKQHEMRQEFGQKLLTYFIGDVRDADRLKRAMEGVDIVIHAAALKQVPACEYNPLEAVKTNIHGAQNIIDAAIDTGVKKVIALSTDKAVNPVNLYGATKLCAEKIFIQGNSYAGPRNTRFSCVRYGNVIGSRGSVIPLFKEQKKAGKITITDKRMTRFWITLDRAVELVVNGLLHMQGGEVFVPKIPSMKVTDLAQAVAPECEIEVIGIRPGEKVHEILVTEEDGRNTVFYNNMYVIMPNYAWWKRQNYREGRKMPDGFTYTSDNNDEWLTIEDLTKVIYGSIPVENDPAVELAAKIHQLNEKAILSMLNAEEAIPEMKLLCLP